MPTVYNTPECMAVYHMSEADAPPDRSLYRAMKSTWSLIQKRIRNHEALENTFMNAFHHLRIIHEDPARSGQFLAPFMALASSLD